MPKLRNVGGARSKSGIRQSTAENDGDGHLQLMRNSQKYDEMMKGRKDELRRKRGALELNSDLEVVDVAPTSSPIQEGEPAAASNFRSKLHDDIKR